MLQESEVQVTEDQVREVVNSFVGAIEQIPPMYSALKVNGKKLYELAREGKVIERKPRPITIHSITILDIKLTEDCHEIRMRVECSKGTYIRTLCHDIGEALGTGGCMKSLVRTKVSKFLLADAITLEEAQKLQQEDKLVDHVIPVEDMFPRYPKVYVNEVGNRFLANGNPLKLEHIKNKEDAKSSLGEHKEVKIYNIDEQFSAIYEWQGASILKPVKMFLN